MTSSKNQWFAAKGLCRWYFKKSGETACIEERLVLVKAGNIDDALSKAESEICAYTSQDHSTANFQIEAVDWLDVYSIGETPVEGVEVYSRLIDTSLSADAYLRRYYPKSQIHKPPAPSGRPG